MKKKFGIFILTFLIVVVLGGAALLLVAQKRNGNTVLVNDGQNVTDAASGNGIAETEIISVDEIRPPAGLQEIETVSEQEEVPEEILDDRTFRLEPSSDGAVVFAFAGDILFDPSYAIFSSYHQRGDRIEECISEELLEEMRNADIMMLNNEFPYTDRGTPTPGKIYTFRAATESVSVLKDMGVDIV
ncbi:MAG: CapA family protein, partial [Lachnospiraceae bacterium]